MKKVLFLMLTLPFLLHLVQAQQAQLDWTSTQNNVYSYSSPRAIDLTADGIKDIVMGAGLENANSNKGIIAVDGSNGTTLWTAPSRNQIYGSPIFQDINNDNVPDAFVGGRAAEFYAISGADGAILWEFFPQASTVNPIDSGWYNFYTAQWLPDQDGDALQDLLLANGGDYNATILDPDRPAGDIMVVSSASGAVIAKAKVPDQKETYMSPLVVDFFHNGNLYILFGTGGENDFNAGHLYKAPLSDLLNNDLSQAQIVATSPQKGFIAPPSLADLNDDSVLDIIVNLYDGKVIAVDGFTNQQLWQAQIAGGETNASPAIGHFNNDNIPDIFSTYAIGLAPTFTDFRQVMIDGATGEIQYNESVGFFQFNSPTVADLDQDGFDEVIMSTNAVDFQTFNTTHEVRVFDFNNNTNNIIYGPLQGLNINSTGLLTNIDNDGQLDFIYMHSQQSSVGNTDAGFFIKKLSLTTTPDNIAIPWGAYIGTNSDGVYVNNKEACNEKDFNFTITTTPIACGGQGSATISSNMCSGGACGYQWYNENLTPIAQTKTIDSLSQGTYYVKIDNNMDCIYITQTQILPTQDTLALQVQVTPASSCTNSNGSVYIQFQEGTPPYTTNFNGSQSNPSNVAIYFQNNIAPGSYPFTLTDGLGCTISQTIEITPLPLQVSYNSQCSDAICAYQLLVTGGTGNYTAAINGQTINNNSFLINESGNYTLIVEDQNGCTYQETLNVTVNNIENLEENNLQIEQNNYMVQINSTQIIDNVEVIDISGKKLYSSQNHSFAHQIDHQNLLKGLYLLKIEINEKIIVKKFCKN